MALDKPIKDLAHLSTAGAPKLTLDEIIAIKLGIEALKYFQRERERRGATTKTMWLPGETIS